MKRWLPWITGAVTAAGLIWSFFYLKDVHPLGRLGAKLEGNHLAGIAIRLKDATLIGRSDGEKVWTFEAETIEVSRDRRLATFRNVTRGSLLQDGKQIASLAANKVVYNTITRNLAVPGGAEFKVEGGPSFSVRDVLWNARKSALLCKNGVDMELAGSTLHGERMTADLAQKELVITKVKGRIRLD